MADQLANYQRSPTGLGNRSVPLDVSAVDHTPTDLPAGFHCNASGDVVGQLADDTADRTFTLSGGGLYSYRFKVVRKVGTTATGLFVYTV